MIGKGGLLTLILLGCLATQLALTQKLAFGSTPVDNSITPISFVPPNDEQPPQTSGAGSRGSLCPQEQIILTSTVSSSDTPTLMALVPDNNYGLTLAEKPTFFIYVPYTSAKQVVLSITGQNNQHHSQTLLEIADTPKVFRIQPSVDSPALEVDKIYRWSVVLVCQSRPGPNDPAIVSWVRRIAPPPTLQIQQLTLMTSLEQAVFYGKHGLWFDTLESLAQARQTHPEDPNISIIWTDFLQSVGLTRISTEPLDF